MGLLEGKRVLITGGRKGIGRGAALTLANEGASVGINDIVDDDITERTVNLINEKGVKGTKHLGDVSSVKNINEVIDSFVNAHGGLDILVNNAIFRDIQTARPLFEVDEYFWDHMMNLTLKGYFFASQRAAKEMIDQRTSGRIICISSVHSYGASRDWTTYGVAKMGMRRMVKGLAADLSGTGITANCVAPGIISNALPLEDDTQIDGEPHDANVRERIKQTVPLQRGGRPSDIANAILFLSSKLGEYVNGETILVDGGLMASAGPNR